MTEQDPANKAIERISKRITELALSTGEQLDALGERLSGHLDRIEARLARNIEQLDADAQRELQETRRDIGELRDKLAQVDSRAAAAEVAAKRAEETAAKAANASRAGTAAAVGAMRNVTEENRSVLRASASRFWKSWWGRVVTIGTAFTALVVALGHVPKAIRVIEAAWTALRDWGGV